MTFRWLRLLGFCLHAHTYMERRAMHGVLVPKWICEACGSDRGPVIKRAPSEHVKAYEIGSSVSRRAPARLRAVK